MGAQQRKAGQASLHTELHGLFTSWMGRLRTKKEKDRMWKETSLMPRF